MCRVNKSEGIKKYACRGDGWLHVAFRPLNLSIGKLWRGNGVKLYFANRLRMPRNSPIRIWVRENALWKVSFDTLSDAAGGVCRLETERHRGRHPLQRSPPLTFVLSKAGNLPCFNLYRTHVILNHKIPTPDFLLYPPASNTPSTQER